MITFKTLKASSAVPLEVLWKIMLRIFICSMLVVMLPVEVNWWYFKQQNIHWKWHWSRMSSPDYFEGGNVHLDFVMQCLLTFGCTTKITMCQQYTTWQITVGVLLTDQTDAQIRYTGSVLAPMLTSWNGLSPGHVWLNYSTIVNTIFSLMEKTCCSTVA